MDQKALENIIRRIEHDANTKIEEYKKMAEERRKKILEKAREELDKEIREFSTKKEREIRNMVNYIVSQAKIGGKRKILEERERGIEAVFFEAEKRADSDPRYRTYLEKSLKKAKESFGRGTVFCRERDIEALKSMLPPDFSLKSGLEETDAGIIAHSADGTRIFDLRISRRLEDMKDELRKDVSQMLYGGSF